MGSSKPPARVAALVLLLCLDLGLAAVEPTTRRLGSNKKGLRADPRNVGTHNDDFREDLQEAVAAALGGGHGVQETHMRAIRERLMPMWRSLPKNSFGRVDRATFRYAVHRYFLHAYSVTISGLEPVQANASFQDAALLTNYAPSYVKTVLEGKAAREGFSVEDAVAMVAALESLVAGSGHTLLEQAYGIRLSKSVLQDVSVREAAELLESYMIRWIMGDDHQGIEQIEANTSLIREVFEGWDEVEGYLKGSLRSFEYERTINVRKSRMETSWHPLQASTDARYSFADMQAVAGGMSLHFGHFWATECTRVKDMLMEMDRGNTGRVKLNKFYGSALDGEWRFSESKEYLEQLGALDESSSRHGPQVIITNYIQAASNCIISAPHYRICCVNECEPILAEIEASVASSTASPEAIMSVVKNVTVNMDDEPPRISSSLRSQLNDIARANNGQVPIHGRLLGQWLHYVFPHECPFPHKSGTTITLSPLQFGDYMASEEQMATHAKPLELLESQDDAGLPAEDDWMTQWSHEEELLSDHARLNSQDSSLTTFLFAITAIVLLALGIKHKVQGSRKKDLLPMSAPFGMKSHSF